MIAKTELIQKIVDRLQEELQTVLVSAKAAHEAATNEESRPEDQHDTRGLEAGYLAGAQAARAEELKVLITRTRELPSHAFAPDSEIGVGSIIEATLDGKPVSYFLVQEGAAGMVIEIGGRKVRVITTRSPIGEELLQRKAGESTEIETGRGMAELEILSVG